MSLYAALIALMLYIFALHGKIAGWWKSFGMAVAAAVSFNGVLMAWYGVNFVLGKGLHSYGFSAGGGLKWVALIISADLMFVALCIFRPLSLCAFVPLSLLTLSASPLSPNTYSPYQ